MTARKLLLFSFLLALSACEGGGCDGARDKPDPGVPAGATNGPCRESGKACDPYNQCTRHVCRSCGGDGERACNFHGPDEGVCEPGLVWEQGSNTCRSSCGKLGLSCCKAYGYGFECADGVSCDTATNKCVSKAPPCAAGPNPIAVTCHLAHGCAVSVVSSYASSSVDEARACVQKSLGCLSVDEAKVEHFKLCVDYPAKPGDSLEVDSTEPAAALECAKAAAGEGANVHPCTGS